MADFIYLFIFPEMMDHLMCDLTADTQSGLFGAVTRVPLKRTRKDFGENGARQSVYVRVCVSFNEMQHPAPQSEAAQKGLIIFKSLTRERNPNNCLF